MQTLNSASQSINGYAFPDGLLDRTGKRNLFNIPISKCQKGVIQSATERWAEQNTVYGNFS